jgi:hypothetical protein
MYGLFLQTETCPDGVELFEVPEAETGTYKFVDGVLLPGRPVVTKAHAAFRFRSAQREPLQLEINNLENPIVVDFVNAGDDEARAEFFEKFGLWLWGNFVVETGVPQSQVLGHQDLFRGFLTKPLSSEDVEKLSYDMSLRPVLTAAKKRGPPRLRLACGTLNDLMTMEIAMITTNGVHTTHCQHCHTMFVTGPLTWRRSHAKFCSDRCRVAAMRQRQRS